MQELHVFDLMPFVHAGNVNKRSFLSRTQQVGAGWETLIIPTGGVSLLFNTLYFLVGKADILVCSDRNPVIKKELCPGYKSNRHNAQDITANQASAEYILQQCNVPLCAREGYEADDIIYTFIMQHYDEYDKIYIYTADSDLYFMVDSKISIKPSSSRAKEVTLENYVQMCSPKNGLCPYNTKTLEKILFGDTSDCIPGLPYEDAVAIAGKLYGSLFTAKMGNYDFVKNLFKHYWPEYAYQVDVVFPLVVSDPIKELNAPDAYEIRNFGDAIHNSKFSGRKLAGFDIEPHITELLNRGAYLIREESKNDY